MVSVLVGFRSAPSAAAGPAELPMTSGVKLVAPMALSSVRRSMFVIALLLIQKMLPVFSAHAAVQNGPRHLFAMTGGDFVRPWNCSGHVDPTRDIDALPRHETRGVGRQKQ